MKKLLMLIVFIFGLTIPVNAYANTKIINDNLYISMSEVLNTHTFKIMSEVEQLLILKDKQLKSEFNQFIYDKENNYQREIDRYFSSKLNESIINIDEFSEYIKEYINKKYNRYPGIIGWLYQLKIENDVNRVSKELKTELTNKLNKEYQRIKNNHKA